MFVSRKLISIQLFARFVSLLNLKRLWKRTLADGFDGCEQKISDGSFNPRNFESKSFKVENTSKRKYLPLHDAFRNFCAYRSSNFVFVSINMSAVDVAVAGINSGLDSSFDLADGGLKKDEV